MNERDIIIMARTVYGEARGESPEGQEAVANVILNRVKHGGWWGTSVIEVCLHPKQFSCWNDGDPNRPRMMEAELSDSVFRSCLEAVLRALRVPSSELEGVCHYHHTNVSPMWSKGLPYISIGNHRFFRGIK